MKFTAAVAVIAAACAAFHSSVRASQEPAARTTGSGIYTEAQAKRGETIYAKTCESCHAKDLSGADQAPSLTGKDFNAEWNDMPLSDLFERIHATMPGDAPGSLQPPEVADVIAFMLSKGGFPPGPVELPNQLEALNTIKFPSAKPDRPAF
jgi:mono/diheme cytochrome c family protein